MKKLIVLAALMVAFVITANAQTQPNQGYYEDCEWYYEQEYTYCEQDWYLFVYWPLECDEACEDTEICLGLFPSSDQEQTYQLPGGYCCEFIVSGQCNWLFYAYGYTDFTNAGGVTANFNWSHGSAWPGDQNPIANGTGFGASVFVLDDCSAGNGHGSHYFQVCATDVTIPAGFNGESHFTTYLGVVYVM